MFLRRSFELLAALSFALTANLSHGMDNDSYLRMVGASVPVQDDNISTWLSAKDIVPPMQTLTATDRQKLADWAHMKAAELGALQAALSPNLSSEKIYHQAKNLEVKLSLLRNYFSGKIPGAIDDNGNINVDYLCMNTLIRSILKGKI